MRHNENVSVAFSARRVVEEFSHSLSLQATRDGRASSAIAEDVIRPACLSFGR